MTIAEHFEKRVGRAGSRVEVELAHAANRVNYNQVWRYSQHTRRNVVRPTGSSSVRFGGWFSFLSVLRTAAKGWSVGRAPARYSLE